MRAICVDGEAQSLQQTLALCRERPELQTVQGFARAQDALEWLKDHRAELALLETELPDMKGLELAERIRELQPQTAIVFVTGQPQYAVDAFALHVAGYVLKPLSAQRLARELAYLISWRAGRPPHIAVQTFGNFVVLVDGKAVGFHRAKSKEMLAYLVDRQGGSVTRAQIFAALWEDGTYDRPVQKQLDVILRSLRNTLAEHGIGEILELRRGCLRIRPELLDCDLYRFLQGEAVAVNAYRGEYMSSYAWGSMTEAFLTLSQHSG